QEVVTVAVRGTELAASWREGRPGHLPGPARLDRLPRLVADRRLEQRVEGLPARSDVHRLGPPDVADRDVVGPGVRRVEVARHGATAALPGEEPAPGLADAVVGYVAVEGALHSCGVAVVDGVAQRLGHLTGFRQDQVVQVWAGPVPRRLQRPLGVELKVADLQRRGRAHVHL